MATQKQEGKVSNPAPKTDPDQLSEEALEQVAGGGCENGVTTLSEMGVAVIPGERTPGGATK